MVQALATELNKFSNNAFVTQHFGYRQHEICCGCTFLETAGQLESNNIRYEHRNGLAEHRRFRLDAANAPTEDAKTIDHRRMRVGSNYGVRISTTLVVLLCIENDPRQVFKVDLVDDSGVWRHDAEVFKCSLAPSQERVTLLVTLEFDFVVQIQGIGAAVAVDLHRVVDNQFCGRQWIDASGAATQLNHRVAHGGQINNRRNASKVLEYDATWREGNLCFRRSVRIPVGQRQDVLASNIAAIFVAQQVFQQDFK